jgi:hypothetical protein
MQITCGFERKKNQHQLFCFIKTVEESRCVIQNETKRSGWIWSIKHLTPVLFYKLAALLCNLAFKAKKFFVDDQFFGQIFGKHCIYQRLELCGTEFFGRYLRGIGKSNAPFSHSDEEVDPVIVQTIANFRYNIHLSHFDVPKSNI